MRDVRSYFIFASFEIDRFECIFLQTVKLPAGDGDAVTDTVVK